MGRKKQEEEGGGSWMDTYGDLVTLLLTFFVMLYSMASVAEDKWAELVKAFNTRFGTDAVDQIVINPDMLSSGLDPLDNTNSGLNIGDANEEPLSNEMDLLFMQMKDYIEENNMQDSISIKQGEVAESASGQNNNPDESAVENIALGNGKTNKNIYIQFSNDVFFNPDESSLKDGSEDVINFLGECLVEVDDEVAMIIIKGHTADVPSPVDGRYLSSDRAAAISNVLERTHKIESTKLYPIGLAGDYPIASNDTIDGQSKNRRVEIVIIGKNSDLAKSGELLKILGASFEKNTGDIQDIATNN